MATGTGIDAQIGYAVETTYGTGVTVTRFLPLISETLKAEIDRVESPGIIAGRQVLLSSQWSAGNKKVGGDVQHELYDTSIGMLLRACFGTVTTTGSGTYTHVFWPVTPSVSLTAQVGRPAVYGSVIPFTYTGCKVASFEIAGKAGENLTAGLTLVAQEETAPGTALASASYTSNIRPWRFQDATITLAGATTLVKGFTFAGDNGLTVERRFLGSTVIQEPLRGDLGAFSGNLDLEWGNPSAQGTLNYHRFVGGTEAALVISAVSGTASATITANIRYDGSSPNVAGRGIVEHKIPFKCIASGADTTAVTVQIVNGDATA